MNKKVILYIIATVGGALVGLATGIIVLLLINALVLSFFKESSIDWEIAYISIVAGAIVVPFSLREKIDLWSDG
jgi:tetrahydromethanopterin S-methyltransferase subunit E